MLVLSRRLLEVRTYPTGLRCQRPRTSIRLPLCMYTSAAMCPGPVSLLLTVRQGQRRVERMRGEALPSGASRPVLVIMSIGAAPHERLAMRHHFCSNVRSMQSS